MKKLIAATVAAALVLGACTPTATANTVFMPGYPETHIGDVSTPGGIFPWENGGYNLGQRIGAENLVRYVDDYFDGGNVEPITLVGYSYGAAIVHTALETIDTRPYADKVHVRLYGNPRHPGGIEDNLHGVYVMGIHFRGAGIRPQNLGSFEDHCNPRDAICDFPGWRKPFTTLDHIVGYFTGAHRYPEVKWELSSAGS